MNDWRAQKAAQAVAAAALQAANPHLVAVGDQRGKNDPLNAAARNIRIELGRAFPGVKFSVKSSRYSGGDSISVRWVDGPTAEQVEQITKAYQGGSFDGMADIYNSSRDAWTDAFGDAKYTFANRDNSAAAVESATRTVFARYAANLVGIERPTAEQFKSGNLWSVAVPGLNDSLDVLIRIEASRRTWALNKTPAAVALVEVDEVAA